MNEHATPRTLSSEEPGQRRNCGFGYIYEKLEFQNFSHSSFEVRVGGTAKKIPSSSPPPSPFSSLLSPLSFSSPLPPSPFSLSPLLSLRKSVYIVDNHAVGSGVRPQPCARWPGALGSWLAGHWALPLGFGLDWRLLLERRGRVYVFNSSSSRRRGALLHARLCI